MIRAPGSTLLRTCVLAAAVALLAAMLVFVSHSLSIMTATAVRSVPLDWQGPVSSDLQARKLAAGTARETGVGAAYPTATAPFSGAAHRSSTGLVQSSNGSILAVPPNYTSGLHTMRFLQGGFAPGKVVLDQQLAATLQAGIGDTITITP